jgi:glycosyltransferase involved in cell wall biosynthesis
VPISRLTLDEVWAQAQEVLKDPARAQWPELPARVQDGVEERWQHYVEMTKRGLSPLGTVPDVPKVSVVIPTYNRADNVERAVKSVLAQAETSLEVIVVDDGSTDDTPERFANPPERVRYIRKPNGGASSARNAGLIQATGDWIALLDSDDEWAPDKLKVQLDAMGEQYVAAACRHVHINADGTRQIKPEVLPGRDNHLFRDLYENLSLKTSGLIFRRHLLDKVGLFNERFAVANDWDFFLRLARAVNNSGMRICEQPLVTVHRSPDSISKTGRVNALREAYTRICIVNALLHTDDPASIRRHVRRAARKHLELSRAYRKAGNKQASRHHAKEAIRAGLILRGAWRWLQA